MGIPLAELPLQKASDLEKPDTHHDILDTLGGRLVEFESGATGGALTAASVLIRKVQQRGQDAVWISAVDSIFFAPDFAASGIDLSRLPVIRAETPALAARSADHLLRANAFSLIIIDLGENRDISLAQQGRLVQLADRRYCTVLLLTDRDRTPTSQSTSSFGSLVSLYGVASCTPTDGEKFRLSVRVMKDKRNGPGWMWQEVCHGPVGFC